MKVILLRDIENFGKKWEVKRVKRGYALNYLIPRGLVKIATPHAMKNIEQQKELEAKKAEGELKTTQGQASLIDGLEIVIPLKVGEEGEVYGSVTNQIITDKLHELGFKNIKKTQVRLDTPIRELGEFPIVIRFEHNLETEIKVIVSKE